MTVLAWDVWLNAEVMLVFFLGAYATYEGDSFFGTPLDYMGTFLFLGGLAALPLVVQ